MTTLYHEVRGIAPDKARDLVRKVLANHHGNVARTAAILGITRWTVRRARDGTLADQSRRPKSIARKTPDQFEKLIVTEAKRTSFRYRRLASYLRRKFSLSLSEHTIRAILKRNRIGRRVRRSKNGKRRHLYDYEHLRPFAEFQLDTKHLLDESALAPEVFDHICQAHLPLYEWHLMEVATRARFTAYSYTLSATFGFLFITLVLLWLRTHNVRGAITIRVDNGAEFCSGSERKLADWNSRLQAFCAVLEPIPPGAKHLMALVENAHRLDDEYFLMIHAERCEHTYRFLSKAQSWQDTWNWYRPNWGLGMHGLTPQERLREAHTLIHDHVLLYPVVLLEDVEHRMGTAHELLGKGLGGKYVYTTRLFYISPYTILPSRSLARQPAPLFCLTHDP